MTVFSGGVLTELSDENGSSSSPARWFLRFL